MKYIGQMMVIASAILAGASLDGWAQDWFGFGGLCIRLAIFSGTFLLGVWLEHRTKRKKAKKKASGKCESPKAKCNKYIVICHS